MSKPADDPAEGWGGGAAAALVGGVGGMELAEVTVEEVAFGLNPQRLPIWGAIRARASAAATWNPKRVNFQTKFLWNYGSLGHLLHACRGIHISFKVILTWGWGWQWPRSWRLSACWWWWATHLRRRRFTWGGTLQNSMISWVRCVVRLTCFYGCRCYKSAYHKFSLDFCLLFGNYVGLSRHGVESIHFVEIWLDLTELYSTT